MATLNVDTIRELFPDLNGTVYLNTANNAVGCKASRDAYESVVGLWASGKFDWTHAEVAGEAARASFARIVGASPDEIAIVPAVSAAAGLVAANMPDAKPGENVVVTADDFTSNLFPWMMLKARGYDVRAVPSPEAYASAADGGTRLIAVSAVHSSTGYRADLAAIGAIAAKSGAWFFVDASQAAGSVALDVKRDKIDLLAAASYKFLLGSRGVGYLYVRRGLLEKIRPIGPGWKAARMPLESFYGPNMDLSPTASRLDTSLAWFAALAERESLGLFERLGLGNVLERNAMLSRYLHDALDARDIGYRKHDEPHRSAIVSCRVSDPVAVAAKLRAANVVTSVRAGRVRLSVHFYNREDEIDRVVGLLAGR